MESAPITDFTFKAILMELVSSAVSNCRVTKTKHKESRSTNPTILGSIPQTVAPAVPAVTSAATMATGTKAASNMTLSSPRPPQLATCSPIDQVLDVRWHHLRVLSLK